MIKYKTLTELNPPDGHVGKKVQAYVTKISYKVKMIVQHIILTDWVDAAESESCVTISEIK